MEKQQRKSKSTPPPTSNPKKRTSATPQGLFSDFVDQDTFGSGPVIVDLPSKNEVIYVWTREKVEVMVYWFKGSLVAHSSLCPHMGSQLAFNFKKGTITCPWHSLCASPVDFKFNHPKYRTLRLYRTQIVKDKVHLLEILPRAESAI